MLVPVTLPGIQVSDPTAEGATAESVAFIPGHVIVGFAVTVMLGPGSTVMVCRAASEQLPFDPTTVYVVVTLGVSDTT
jgi:hypothetical protein